MAMTDEKRPTLTVVHPDSVSGGPRNDQQEAGADQVMDALAAAGRLTQSQRTVMDDVDSKDGHAPLSDQEVGDIIRAVKAFLEAQDELPRRDQVTGAQIARATGEAASTVSAVLNDVYPEGRRDGFRKRDEVLRKLDKFVATEKARRASPKRSGFAWIGVAKDIRTVAETCVYLETIGAAFAPAGVGKTMTLTALLEEIPGSLLLTIDDGTHSPTAFLRELCSRLKASSGSRDRQASRRAICAALTNSKRLIMVDEAHLASVATLNCIRQIFDTTGCPVLLVGLPSLPKMLLQGRGDDSRGATLYSRVGIIRDLTERCRAGSDPGEPLYSIEDIKKVFARSQLRIASDANEWLVDLAKLVQASRLLHGIEGAKIIDTRIKQRRAAGA